MALDILAKRRATHQWYWLWWINESLSFDRKELFQLAVTSQYREMTEDIICPCFLQTNLAGKWLNLSYCLLSFPPFMNTRACAGIVKVVYTQHTYFDVSTEGKNQMKYKGVLQHEIEIAFTLKTWIKSLTGAINPVRFLNCKTVTHTFDHIHDNKMANMSWRSADLSNLQRATARIYQFSSFWLDYTLLETAFETFKFISSGATSFQIIYFIHALLKSNFIGGYKKAVQL